MTPSLYQPHFPLLKLSMHGSVAEIAVLAGLGCWSVGRNACVSAAGSAASNSNTSKTYKPCDSG